MSQTEGEGNEVILDACPRCRGEKVLKGVIAKREFEQHPEMYEKDEIVSPDGVWEVPCPQCEGTGKAK